MGLLSQDTMNLEVLTKSSGPKEQKYATVILKLVSKHHLLLVTLLLANAAAVEAMPIFLNQIANEVIAVVVSVTAVLLFGEYVGPTGQDWRACKYYYSLPSLSLFFVTGSYLKPCARATAWP